MLKLVDLTVGYGAFHATHGIALEVRAGTVFALVGANGAGKSSTIMSIAGHTEVHGGCIEFDGQDITHLPINDRVRRGIALAPEGRRLFADLSVAENLMLGGYARPRAEEAANRDMVLDLFPRLRERLDQRAGTLSGGEQQMLAIGRALMAGPKMLMIDEVSLGLMPKAVDICYAAIARLRERGITVLLVEQSTKRALEAADDVCVLESGRIVWSGTAAAARQDPAVIEAYMGLAGDGAHG
ncbi:MAG: ABC transporter ATP-binding protein [Hyphomicrobiales bacterium]|nr:ABC transporter ATP-binding protein [Hyphomicrobiales bacterium]MCP5372259.1 ABC transporter ATP-binding protein [Hyphomicrobiales bacterium]